MVLTCFDSISQEQGSQSRVTCCGTCTSGTYLTILWAPSFTSVRYWIGPIAVEARRPSDPDLFRASSMSQPVSTCRVFQRFTCMFGSERGSSLPVCSFGPLLLLLHQLAQFTGPDHIRIELVHRPSDPNQTSTGDNRVVYK